MVTLIEDELKRALVRNELTRVYEILMTGKICGLSEDNIPEGATVLHLAAILGYRETVESLLTKAISDLIINFQDEGSNWTPLMHAISNREQKIAKMLLVSGKCDVNIRDSYQQSALHIEAQSRSTTAEIAYYLVKYGANIEIQDGDGMTPFLRAVESNNITVAKFLFGRRCDVGETSSTGMGALHIAAQHCHEEMLQWLIRIGCPVNAVTDRLQTPLMLTVIQRKPAHLVFKIVKYLVAAGTAINSQDWLGNTALLLATSNAGVIRKHHIQLLLVHGCDPNIVNREGLTPLWQAVYDGIHYSDRLKIIEMFIAQNSYLDMPCRGHLLFMSGTNSVYSYENFMSPIEVAMDSGFYSAARLLLLSGATVNPDLRYDAQYTEHIPKELQWFQDLIQTPIELQHLCRLVIRQVLGKSIHSKVRKLPLPEKIKSYVLLEDILSEDTCQ